MVRTRTQFAVGELYHVYNRGTDKRVIFRNRSDSLRFLKSMCEFNTVDPVGSLFVDGHKNVKERNTKPLVEILAYCLNPNHYHLILRQLVDGGVSEFMKRLGGGYTGYFNDRTKRSGVLFQGGFKSKHIATEKYLHHVAAYVHLNFRIHKLDKEYSSKNSRIMSSWGEYMNPKIPKICEQDFLLGNFCSKKEYSEYCKDVVLRVVKGREVIDDFNHEK